MRPFGIKFHFKKHSHRGWNQRGSAMVLTMVTSVVFVSFLYAVSQTNRNLSSQYNSAKDLLAAFKSTQEIAATALASAYASGMSGSCPPGTVRMSMTSVNGNAVSLCMKGQLVANSICINNPNATADSERKVCISGVGSGGTLSSIPTTTVSLAGGGGHGSEDPGEGSGTGGGGTRGGNGGNNGGDPDPEEDCGMGSEGCDHSNQPRPI